MKTLSFLAGLLLALLPASGNPADYLDLVEAFQKGQVAVKPFASYGENNSNLQCVVKNTGQRPLQIRVSPGLHFMSEDPGAQDLFTYQLVVFTLAPQAEQVIGLKGFCMEAPMYSPYANSKFVFKGYAPDPLKSLGDSLNKYPALAPDYGQMFVWALTDGRPLHDIAVDKTLLKGAQNIVRYVAQQVRQAPVQVANGGRAATPVLPVSVRPYTPGNNRPTVKTFSKRANLAFHNKVPRTASLILYGSDGSEQHVFFRNRRLQAGVLNYAFGINETVPFEADPEYIFKLIDNTGQVLTQLKVNARTVEREITPQIKKFKLHLELKKAVKESQMAIFLEDGTLVEELENYKYLPIGTYDFDLAFDHLYPAGTRFLVKLVGTNGTVYLEQKVPVD